MTRQVKLFVFSLIHFIKTHKIITLIIFGIIVIAAFFLKPKPPKPVPVEAVKRGNLMQTISVTGDVDADRDVELKFEIGGKLQSLNVKKGDYVKKGQVIATLDQSTALKNLKTALLNYSLQRNTFDQTVNAQPAHTPSDALNESMRTLLENNQYNLDLAVNSVEIQDLARQKSVLTTPIDGIVTRADVKTSGVTIATTTTFGVTDPDSLSFRMEVDEADISKVSEGQQVDVDLNAYPDNKLHLTVDSIDFVTHTTSTGGNAYDVKAKIIPTANMSLRVGMNGNATIITNRKENIITIPLASLVDENTVYVRSGTSYEKRKIKLGIQSDTDAEVVNGLSEGELLVIDPNSVPVKK